MVEPFGVVFPLYRPVATSPNFGADLVRLAELMIASVRRHMPAVKIVQHTTPGSPRAPSADGYRMAHMGQVDAVPWHFLLLAEAAHPLLLLDVDCIVQRDVSEVWEGDFDVAVVRFPDSPGEVSGGTIFCRVPEFWEECRKAYLKEPTLQDGWFGTQIVLQRVMRQFKVTELEPAVYQHIPRGPQDRGEGAAIVHYRGRRKAWLESARRG